MNTMHQFARTEVFPSWYVNAIGHYLSVSAFQFELSKLDATHIQVVAAADEGAATIAVEGRWRYIEASASRAHPGGAAGTYDIYVTALDNDIQPTPDLYTDDTVYSFALAIEAAGVTPTIVPGAVELYRKVGSLQWDGAQITRIDQTVPNVSPHAHTHATAGSDPIAPADIGAATAAALTAEIARAEAAEATLVPTNSDATLDSLSLTGAGTALNVSHNASITGTLAVGSSGSFAGTLTLTGTGTGLSVSNNATITGTLAAGATSITGAATATSDITARSGAATATAIGAVGPGGKSGITFQGGEAGSNLYRSAAGTLTIDGALAISGLASSATAAVDTNTTQLATTAFVLGQAAAANPVMNGAVAVGVSTRYARADHVHASDTSRASLAGANTFASLQTLQAGLTLDAGAGTVGQTLTLTGRSGGAASSATLAVDAVGNLTWNVPTGDAVTWQVAGVTKATLSSSALNLATGVRYQVGGVQIALSNLSNSTTGTGTTVVLSASPTLTGTLGLAAFTASGAGTVTGLITGQAGLMLDAGAGTAGQTITLAGRSSGTASSATIAVDAVGNLTRNVPTSSTHAWQVNAATKATLSASALNLASGLQYQVNGAQISTANLSDGTTGTGAIVLAASPALTGTATIATAAVTTLSGTPNFSGAATGQTAAVGDNTTKLATTAFVIGQAAAVNPVMDGVVAIGVSTRYARADHVHPTDTSRAALAANTFTALQTLQAGLRLDAGAGTAGQTLTLVGRSGGTAASATIAVDAVGNLTWNVPTGDTHVWQVNAATQATLSASALNLGSGVVLQYNGADINTAGTLSNHAYLNRAQTFTATQTIQAPSGSVVGLALSRDAGTGLAAPALLLTGRDATGAAQSGTISADLNGILQLTATVIAPGSGTGIGLTVSQPNNSQAIRLLAPAAFTSNVIQEACDTAAGAGWNFINAFAGSTGGVGGTDQFKVRGDGTIFAQNTTVQSISDQALKDEIKPLAGALDTILALKPRAFRWREHPHNQGRAGRRDYGLIAQEVEELLPHLVDGWDVGGDGKRKDTYKTLGLTGLIPFLVGAVQELASRVKELEAA